MEKPHKPEPDVTQVVATRAAPSGLDDGPRLIVVSGGAPRTYRIRESLIVGRGVDANVPLECGGVSRRHARVFQSEGRHWVEDLGSKNGTFVNGRRIEKKALDLGDEIRIGQDGHLLFTRATVLEDRLVEQQKMEAIGRLSAGVAHEFNNLLAIVLASLEYLRALPDEVLKRPDVEQALTDAVAAAGQATVVTRGLLGFAKPARAETVRVELAELLGGLVRLVRRTFDRSIAIELEVAPGLAVEGDSGLLFQAFLNLCLNARDAMPDGGTLRIGATLEQVEGSPPSALVAISDTGVGMSDEQAQRAFEPFFTSKGSGRGTGLGLALVYGIIKTHGGTVDVRSTEGEGTTIVVGLPASVSDKPAYRRRITRTVRLSPASERTRVLLVDDEPLVRRSYARVLERAGYEASVAADGQVALQMYEAADPGYNVVILDLNMPGLNGAQTFARLLAMDPGARVVILSGYADRERDALLAQGARAVLGKPCPIDKLTATIEQALGPESDRRP